MTATMPKRCWQQCQRNNNASAATTEGRHAPRQRNDCQWDAGDDASGKCAKEGDVAEDNGFGTKCELPNDASASTARMTTTAAGATRVTTLAQCLPAGCR